MMPRVYIIILSIISQKFGFGYARELSHLRYTLYPVNKTCSHPALYNMVDMLDLTTILYTHFPYR